MTANIKKPKTVTHIAFWQKAKGKKKWTHIHVSTESGLHINGKQFRG